MSVSVFKSFIFESIRAARRSSSKQQRSISRLSQLRKTVDQQSPLKWAARDARAFPYRPIHAQSAVCQSEDDYLYIRCSVAYTQTGWPFPAAAVEEGGEDRGLFLSFDNES